MERCMDCNSLLTKEEKVCIECGSKVGGEDSNSAGLIAGLVSIAFYLSLAVTIGSLFIDRAPSSMVCMMMTFALMFIMRSAQESVTKVKKR
jgi:hypothetical protein